VCSAKSQAGVALLIQPLTRIRDRLAPALAYAQYSRLWQANAGSQIAFWMQQVSQGWLVLELTESAFALGLLAFFRSIPMLLLSPIGGVLADRLDRRAIVITAQALIGITMLIIAILVQIERIHMVHLIISSLVVGTSFAINMPSRTSLVAGLVPRQHLSNAIALHSTTMNTARILGPSIAGLIIGAFGIAVTYFTQVLGYVWSTVNMFRITSPPRAKRPRTSTLTDLREGFAYVARNKTMLALMLLALGPSLFGMPVTYLMPAFVRQSLGAGPEALGFLLGALGVGALAGSVVVVTYSNFRFKGRALFGAILMHGLLLVGLSFTRSIETAAIAIAFVGFFQSVYMATNQATLLLLVPDDLRGRVMSLRMMTFGLSPLGLLPMSYIAEVRGVSMAMWLGGVFTFAVGVCVLLWARNLWNLQPEHEGLLDRP